MSTVETKLTLADQQAPRGSQRAVLVLYDATGAQTSTRVVELPDRGVFTIGRSRSADLRSDSERVSRIHARFERRGAELYVEDAGSRNGTWVNGEQIAGPRLLASGDEVIVGPVTVVVSVTSPVVARTRIESPRTLEERLAAELDRAHRYTRKLSLAMMELAGDPPDADAVWDRVAGELRTMDTMAEYAPAVHAIVLPELDAAEARAQAEAIVAAGRGGRGELVLAVGVATYPEHGTTADALIARARSAQRSAGRGAIAVPPDDPDPASVSVIAIDPQMKRVYELVRKVADHSITVLVQGETGVGKEVVAGAIHATSSRRKGPFVRLNCASLPEQLLESELFGHEKGAFTGADRKKQGFFDAASGGTLFLDEIGEMSPAVQAKLLRVLETHTFTRVGGTDPIEVDVRVVCATHRDLERAPHAFRQDLFFRISAFTILVPPLRDRPSEIIPLARAFVDQAMAGRKAPTLSDAAADAMRRYAWPGNVRELKNAIERAVVLHAGSVIELEDLPDRVREGRTLASAPAEARAPRDVRDRLADFERSSIVAALEACGGSQTEAAKQLGLTRRTLIYRMEKHGLKPLPESRKAP